MSWMGLLCRIMFIQAARRRVVASFSCPYRVDRRLNSSKPDPHVGS